MDSNSHDQPHHIVLLPFLAQGHLIPFLSLARQILKRSTSIFTITITIASTSANLQYLRRSSDANDNKNKILFAELPFFNTEHNTENLCTSQIPSLCHATLALQSPFRELIGEITKKNGRPPLCVISDVFLGWAAELARSLGIFSFTFTTCGAYSTMAYMSLWLHLPHRCADTDEFSLPGFPKRCRFHRSQLHRPLRFADGKDEWSTFMQPQISLSLKSHGWLCNTVEEIEPLGLEILRNFTKIPVWPINVSSSSSVSTRQRSGKEMGTYAEKCVEWLNTQPPESVVYISFGSQNTISVSEMMELAKGLEKSRRPFIWVVRPPSGFEILGDFQSEKWLPEGFEERMGKRKLGLIVRNWAPQVEILSHESTAVFMSHCGWNSVMESLSEGVPIAAWPLGAEQAHNAKMLREEMGVCVEMKKGMEDSVDEEEVKRVIDLVTDKKGKGGEIKKKANEIREKIRGALREEGENKGSSVKAMDDFLAYILANRKEIRQ